MSTMLGRAISTTVPLRIAVTRFSGELGFASVTLAEKVKLHGVRIVVEKGVPRLAWPVTQPTKKGGRAYPVLEVIDDNLRAFIESRILREWRDQPSRKVGKT